MTISTTTSKVTYNGNGVTTAFAFPYYFFEDADLTVVLVSSAGVETVQTLTTHYTVSGEGTDSSGQVTMLTAPAVGEKLVIRRVLDIVQETDYIEGDPFPAETHERALDRLTMIDLQQQEELSRTVTVPVGTASSFSAELPPIVAERFLRVNTAGDGFELVDALDPGTLVVTPFIETLLDDANAAEARTTLGAMAPGAITGGDLTMSTARMLGRTTAGGGAIEELTSAQVTANFVDAASQSAAGKVELATASEFNAGSDGARVPSVQVLRENRTVFLSPVTLTNQTFVDFTGIPAWATEIDVFFKAASSNGADAFMLQLIDSGGEETTGYQALGITIQGGSNPASLLGTTGFVIGNAVGNTDAYSGVITLKRYGNTNTWMPQGSITRYSGAYQRLTTDGEKTLSSTLTGVRVTTVNGTNQYDAGALLVGYR